MRELKIKATTVIDDFTVGYENDPTTRSLIQLLFPFTSPLDFLIGWKGAQIYRRRVEELLDTVIANVSELEDSAVTRDFLETEEFWAILASGVEIAARSTSNKKRQYVAQYLTGIIREGHAHDLSGQIAEDLRVLQDFHLDVLRSIPGSLIPNVLTRRATDMVIDLHKLKEITGFDWAVFNKAICDIERLGFIKHTSEATAWEGGDCQTCRPTKYLNIFNAAICADSEDMSQNKTQ